MGTTTIAALAAGSLSFAKVHAHDLETLEQTEKSLEKEICRDNKAPPKGSIPRFAHRFKRKSETRLRHHGERLLHSKYVLLTIVILNILDCILVMGELILDIHFIVDVLEKSEALSDNFMQKLEYKYPAEMSTVNDISQLYDNILHSSIHWNTTINSPVSVAFNSSPLTYNNDGNTYNHRDKREASTINGSLHKTHHKEHSVIEDIAHGFHKASITILAILVVETGCKIFCFGKHMLENKLEVFDCFIVFASFILDLVFIKGITVYPIQKFVFILAFLVPWRVLRVVNSLIVAIIDHEHFRMKLLYQQKKQISIQVKEVKKEVKLYEKSLQCLEQLCISSGIAELKIRSCTADLKNRKKKPLGPFGSLSNILSVESEEMVPMVSEDENKNGTVTFSFDSVDPSNIEDI